MIARNAARPASRQRKKYRSGWCQFMFSFRSTRAAKGRRKTGSADPCKRIPPQIGRRWRNCAALPVTLMGWGDASVGLGPPHHQNVGKRGSAVRAAFDLCQKADCDRPVDRVARGCPACARVCGERCEGSGAFAAIVRHCRENRSQDALLGSRESTGIQ